MRSRSRLRIASSPDVRLIVSAAPCSLACSKRSGTESIATTLVKRSVAAVMACACRPG